MIDRSKVATCTAALTLVLALSGCSSLRGEAADTGLEETRAQPSYVMRETEPATAGGNVVVETQREVGQSFNFEATELFSGASIYGTDLIESKPIIVTFVSPDCLESVDQALELGRAADANEDITYVFVHTGGDRVAYENLVDGANLYQQNVVHIDDTGLALTTRFDVKVTPSSILVDAEGSASFSVGRLDEEGLRDAADLIRLVEDQQTPKQPS